MNIEQLVGVIKFLEDDMTEAQAEKCFNYYLQAPGGDKQYIKEIVMNYGSFILYEHISQHEHEVGRI